MLLRPSILLLPVVLAACSGEEPAVDANAAVTATPATPAAPAPAPAAGRQTPAPQDWSGFGNGAVSVVRRGDGFVPALFLCNATNQPTSIALTVPAHGDATLVRFDDVGRGIETRAVSVGGPDPGAGQIYYPLSADGREVGYIHAANSQMLDGATTPTVTSLGIDGADLRCRWQPQTRFLGLTARRAVLVTGPEDGPLVYRSFDFAERADQDPVDNGRTTRATLTVTGGERRGDTLVFRNGATEYRIRASGDPAAGAAAIEVFRAGARVQSEPVLAYTLGATAASPPPRVSTRFGCEDGSSVAVLFDNVADRAELSFAGGRIAVLAGQRPASGMWYAGAGYALRGKGDTVTITTPDGARRLCTADR
ncbi:membrane-bound inhibitor of C-type lysozyme [Sphingomonas jejuensis]|uniref:Membrane-bound inhibitor of C-type lysozyme n=1 Tax=Sphingomonas jejuensis TaxID=904715 RepID=A0ABX0XRC1_9SPHN|nr:MliC family protein [Sphingomonas jejuensis]NJC35241.1 membrane-bound inhibitor of C-type lysozyme [Sphingomonas jejuensis]